MPHDASSRQGPGVPDVREDRGGSPAAVELDELLRYEHEHAGRPAVLRMLRARRERLRDQRLRGEEGDGR